MKPAYDRTREKSRRRIRLLLFSELNHHGGMVKNSVLCSIFHGCVLL